MLRQLAKGLKELIYPDCCPGCGAKKAPTRPPEFICASCRDKLERNLPPFCVSCGRHLEGAGVERNICPPCLRVKFNFDRAFSPCRYSGIIKKLIRDFKYAGDDYLGEGLGKIMNEFIREYNLPLTDMDYIIPIPLHKSRLREREFNQAQILSDQISREFNKMVLPQVLMRTKATKTQAELGHEERLLNVENSFYVTRPELIRDRNLLLIDDVLTTGATANQAAAGLKGSGARKVTLLTLAS
ncbi:MAG: ComF family protein [Candidatus Omnitrophica bacterium]|nr:ComF family protein [Candidatus Omnitrophota bacterium]